ncbi:hypothetical protein V5T82_16885 [Magnetovibrio sp. PR-2]|uniref:hypothetical protein n=1 Tax=Magnetovibrio sp. PR-2 TaxID=3120356 RepID=UPI002FCE52B4
MKKLRMMFERAGHYVAITILVVGYLGAIYTVSFKLAIIATVAVILYWANNRCFGKTLPTRSMIRRGRDGNG